MRALKMVIWQYFLSYVKVEVAFIYISLVVAASIKKNSLVPLRCSLRCPALTFTKMLSGSVPLLVVGSIFLNPAGSLLRKLVVWCLSPSLPQLLKGRKLRLQAVGSTQVKEGGFKQS